MRIKTQTLVKSKIQTLVPVIAGSVVPEVDNLLLESGDDFLLEAGGYILLEGGVPPIVTDQLVVHLDASNPSSYSGSGTTWYNLIAGGLYDGTLTSAGGLPLPSFVSNGDTSYFSFSSGSSTQRQTVDITGLDIRRDFSLEIWFRYLENGDSHLFGQGVNTTNQGLTVQQNQGVKAFNMTSNNYQIDNNYTGDGAWKQLVFTYDHDSPYTKTIYENGLKLGNSTTGQSAYAGTGTFRLNTYLSSGGGFAKAKQIALVRVYTKTLSDSEVFQNYVVDNSRFNIIPLTGTLRCNLDFADSYSYPGTGTNVKDIAGQARLLPFSASPGCVFGTGFGGNLAFSGSPDPGDFTSLIDFSSASTGTLPWHATNPTMTLDWWVTLTSSGAKTHTFLGSANNTTAPIGNRFTFQAETIGPSHTTARLVVKKSPSTSVVTFNSTYTIPVGTPVNVTLTKTGYTYKLYINGVFKETIVDGSSNTYSTGQSAIGTNCNMGNAVGSRSVDKFQGNLYNFRAYSSVLTDAEVLENFNYFKSRFGL